MLPRVIRWICLIAILSSLLAATVLAGDPWHTGNPWNAPSSAASISGQGPMSIVSSVPSVATVPSSAATVQGVPYGVVPTPRADNLPFSTFTPIAPLTAVGMEIRGNPAAGAHIVTMKCAGCHGQDGSGQGTEMIGLTTKQQAIPWTNKAAMAGLTDQQIAAKISQGDPQNNPESVMPAFGGQLSSEDINNVVAYIRTLGQ